MAILTTTQVFNTKTNLIHILKPVEIEGKADANICVCGPRIHAWSLEIEDYTDEPWMSHWQRSSQNVICKACMREMWRIHDFFENRGDVIITSHKLNLIKQFTNSESELLQMVQAFLTYS